MTNDEHEPKEPTPQDAPSEAPAPDLTPFMRRRVVDIAASPVLQPAAAGGPAASEQPKSSGPTVTVQEGSLEDFEALLAEAGAAPRRERVEVGERLTGTVVSVGKSWADIDLGGGREGIARVSDFTDRDGVVSLEVGAQRDFFVIGTRDGTITLGDQLSTREAGLDAVQTAVESGLPLTGRVVGKNKGGFEIDLGGVAAFCPISQIELAFTEDPDVHLGRSYSFRVMEVRDGGRSVVVSRAELLREEQQRAAANALESLQVDSVIDGTITRLADFGAFVDIGGIEGLIHVSELGFTRVDHPSEVVREGEAVRVKVLSVEQSDRGVRIGLSMKETMEDPWEAAMRSVFAGAKLSGTVTRLEPFGAFIEIAPNVEGLVHVSEMSWEKHVKRPSDIVRTGQVVAVEVLDVDLPRRRVSLSMKAAAGDPWSTIDDRYVLGQTVRGTVENIEDFGVFVSLGDGITALLPRSESELSGSTTLHARWSRGDAIEAQVLAIDASRRRMSLTLKSADQVQDAGASSARGYSDAAASGLGTFGDLFKNKLK